MRWFRDMPFQRKLRVAMLLTSTVTLVMACLLFLTLEYFGHRRNLEHTLNTLARLSSENLTAPIAFEDESAARAALEHLRADALVMASGVYTAEGRLFVGFANEGGRLPARLSEGPDGLDYDADYVRVRHPIAERGRSLGTLYIQASIQELQQRVQTLAIVMLMVLSASITLAWILSVILQRTLARPILELANTAGLITSRQDWSLRARRYGKDELAQLTDDFNAMLERTQEAVTALRESESQLRLVTDNVPVSLARFDRDLRVMFVNRPNAARFGLKPEAAVGMHGRDLLGEENFREVEPHMRQALSGKQVVFEREFDFPVSGHRWMEVSYVPEPAPHGQLPSSFVAIVVDVTERRMVAQEIARARDEALAASRAKDDFLAALSHELRTPLNPVLLLASERARQQKLEPAVQADFETIRLNIELEARLIDDLLDLTRVTRGKLSIQRQRIDLRSVIDQTLSAVRAGIDAKEIDFALRHRASRSEILGDAVRLQQVLWNVLKNAIKFTPEGGRISMDTRNPGDGHSIEVSVTDTGIGMTDLELERVFEAFAQGDHMGAGGSHRFGGLGLGLSIARTLVELHDGRIAASSAGRGAGASFTITLPLAPVEHAPEDGTRGASETGEAKREASRTQHSSAGGATPILLVEDHAPTRLTLMSILQARGHQVVGAATVEEALEAARSAKPAFQVLLSDIGLPDGDGCSLMRTLRQQFPELRGIALSGYGMDEDLERSREAGFLTHLTKPVSVADLDAVLAEVFVEP